MVVDATEAFGVQDAVSYTHLDVYKRQISYTGFTLDRYRRGFKIERNEITRSSV